MLELFQYPFMQRALISGVVLAALLASLGVLVVIRKMAFFSDGIAHASLAGVAAGVFFGANPLVTAVIASALFAAGMFFVEKKTTLSSDTVIGLVFTSGMAAGVLLMSLKKGYQPELIGFLFGNILTIKPQDLVLILALALSIGIYLRLCWRKLTLVAMDREMAYLSGLNANVHELVLYVVLAVSVVLALKILGVLLVSALLIIPVSISKLVSRSFRGLTVSSILISEGVMVSGLAISFLFDLPAGAVIVLTGSALFFLTLLFRRGA